MIGLSALIRCREGTVIIRLAEKCDLEMLCRLYVDFHEFHVRSLPARLLSLGAPETYDCTELSETLAKLLSNPDAAIFVADADGRVIGFAEVYLRHDESNAVRVAYQYGYLQSLMVDPAFRGCGVGTQLVKATERWAEGRGAAEMRLETWEFPQGSLSFYERVGYTTLRRMLIHPLVLS